MAESLMIPPLVEKQIEDRLVLRIQNGLNLSDDEDMFERPTIYQELVNFAEEEGITILATDNSNLTPGSAPVQVDPQTGRPVSSKPPPTPAEKLFVFIVTQLITKIMDEMNNGNKNFNWLIEDYETQGESLGPGKPYKAKPIDCFSLISIFVDILHDTEDGGIKKLNTLLMPSARGQALRDAEALCQVIIKYLKGINPSKESTPEELRISEMLGRLAYVYGSLYYEGPEMRKIYLNTKLERGANIFGRLDLSSARVA